MAEACRMHAGNRCAKTLEHISSYRYFQGVASTGERLLLAATAGLQAMAETEAEAAFSSSHPLSPLLLQWL